MLRERSKIQRNNYILYDSTCMKFLKTNLQRQKADSGFLGLRVGAETDGKQKQGNFWKWQKYSKTELW